MEEKCYRMFYDAILQISSLFFSSSFFALESSMSCFSQSKSNKFLDAAKEANLPLVKSLSLDPEVDLNWRDGEGWTPLFWACTLGHVAIVRFLLDFTERSIDCNLPNNHGITPFSSACLQGHEELVLLQLNDQRIDVNYPNQKNQTALWGAACYGRLGVILLLMASERLRDAFKIENYDHSITEIACNPTKTDLETDEKFQERKKRCLPVASLLVAFEENPQKITGMVKGVVCGLLAGEVFALVVYLSDGYLELPAETPIDTEKQRKARRFLSLAAKLPMDLQMVLCNRIFNIKDPIISLHNSEEGFKKFASQGS